MADYLEARLEENNGITGFGRGFRSLRLNSTWSLMNFGNVAPGMLADADDTAKSIYFLSLLGRPTNCDAMLKVFEEPNHFKTYKLETKESFSANCNVLTALLGSKDSFQHVPQICKALTFLCSAWDNGKWGDKSVCTFIRADVISYDELAQILSKLQNIEPEYTMMLFANALASAIEHWNDGALEELGPKLLASWSSDYSADPHPYSELTV